MTGNRQEEGKIVKSGKKQDIWLIAGILVIALAAALIWQLRKETGAHVIVRIDGSATAEYSLNQDREVELEGYQGGKNLMRIRDGRVSVTEADCPDGICVNEGEIQYSGQTIVCLPHRIVIEIEGAEEALVDQAAR